jgi:hypothetical protein
VAREGRDSRRTRKRQTKLAGGAPESCRLPVDTC